MGTELEATLVVIDSWPWLEWLKRRDPGRGHVNRLLSQVEAAKLQLMMCRINYGEVIYSIRKTPDILDTENALRKFRNAPIALHSVDDALVDEAVELKSKYAFAFADAFAAALAIRRNAPLITGDREFRKLEDDGLLTLMWTGA